MRFRSDQYDIEAWVAYYDTDEVLPEHSSAQRPPDRRSNGHQYTKGYLEMQESKKFGIMVRIDKPSYRTADLRIRLYIDGRNFHAEIFEETDKHRGNLYIRHKVYMVRGGQSMVGTLRSAPLAKTPTTEEVSADRNLLDKLNSIIIEIDEGTTTVTKAATSLDTQLDVGMVHDQNTMGHATVSARNLRGDKSLRWKPSSANPAVCSFIWKYYTRDTLIAKGVIPGDPAPLIDAAAVFPNNPFDQDQIERKRKLSDDAINPVAVEGAEQAVASGSGQVSGEEKGKIAEMNDNVVVGKVNGVL